MIKSLIAMLNNSEHTPSYYAATANQSTDYPQLEGDINVDVVVVGGGFSGVNTALELAERGYQVALLEARRIGWGASGRNGGQIIGGYATDELDQFKKTIGVEGVKALHQMGADSVDIIRQRVKRYDINCDLTWGYCDVATKPSHMRDFEEAFKESQNVKTSYKLELLDKSQLCSEVRSDRYIGGLLDRQGAGHCHPLNLCIGEVLAATSLGVQIFEQSPVTNIQKGERPIVKTATGTVNASFVVLCCNAYIEQLMPEVSSKVLPCSSSVIATEPLNESQIAATMPGNRAVCDARNILDYFRLSADKRLIFGGQANYTGRIPKDIKGTIGNKMLKVFPSLATVNVDYGWSGMIGVGYNRLPQAGRVGSNIYAIQAYSGHGINTTHLMAKLTAQMIAGQAEQFDLFASVKHWSFPGGKHARGPLFAMGMLYYRMLDAL